MVGSSSRFAGKITLSVTPCCETYRPVRRLARDGWIVTDCKARAVDLDGQAGHLHDLAVGHAAFAQTPFRVEVWIVEEVDGRYLFHNYRRTASGSPKKILL